MRRPWHPAPARAGLGGRAASRGRPRGPAAAARPLRLRLLGSSPTCGDRWQGRRAAGRVPLQTRKSLQALAGLCASLPRRSALDPRRPAPHSALGAPRGRRSSCPARDKGPEGRRSARPGPGPPSPPLLCSPRLRVQRQRCPATLDSCSSAAPGCRGAHRGGRRQGIGPAPSPPTSCPAAALRSCAGRGQRRGRGPKPADFLREAAGTFGNLCARARDLSPVERRLRSWVLRPSCVSGGGLGRWPLSRWGPREVLRAGQTLEGHRPGGPVPSRSTKALEENSRRSTDGL